MLLGRIYTIRLNMKKIDWKKQYAKHPVWEWTVDIIGIGLLTILFSWIIVRTNFTGELFKSAAEIDTPELIDIYTISANNANLKSQSDVVLMPIDGCSRHDLTTILQELHTLPVAAIGVDVTFPYPDSEDSTLLKAIKADKRIVMASRIGGSYFEEDLTDQGVVFGSIQLNAKSRYDIVRTFTPTIIEAEDTLPTFESQLAQLIRPQASASFSPNKPSYIAYSRVLFDTIPAQTLLDEDFNRDNITERVEGKIVLLGDLELINDTYRTPLQADMPGVVIHAYILDTILRDRIIKLLPLYASWLIACLLAFGAAWGLLLLKWKASDAEGLLLRIAQIVFAFIIAVIGVLMFSDRDYYVNMEPVFFALAVLAVTLDIWVGIMKLVKHIFKLQ